MALRFMESFDHTTSLAHKWTIGNGSPGTAVNGRFGTRGLLHQDNRNWIGRTFDAQATWIVGMAVKPSSISSNNQGLMGFVDAGSAQVELALGAGNIFRVLRNNTVIATGSQVLSAGTYYYVEIKVTFSNASGIAVVKIDGTTDINGSGLDTQNTANASADQIRIGGNGINADQGQSWNLDDVYICDATGGSPTNDFLGDVRVEALFPNANGNSSQFVGSDANSTDNYLLVDETTPNDDTDYVESSTIGNKDTYAYSDLVAASGTVYGVQILPYARKTDAGLRKFTTVTRLSGTEVDGSDHTLASNYQYFYEIQEAKPGGGAWSISDINSAEFGVKVTV